MKQRFLGVAMMAMALAAGVAACSDDDDNSGTPGAIPGGKKLAKIVNVDVREELVDGVWTNTREDEYVTTLEWSGNRLARFYFTDEGEIDDDYIINYSSDDRIEKITDGSRTYVPEYDGQGRVVKTTRFRDGDESWSYLYTYDASGNIAKIREVYNNDEDEHGNTNSEWYEYTLTWQDGNVVRREETSSYNDETDVREYTYDNKVNVMSCIPTDFLLTVGASADDLSHNNRVYDNHEYSYSGDYLVKQVSKEEWDERRYTYTTYYEYTDGTGRR